MRPMGRMTRKNMMAKMPPAPTPPPPPPPPPPSGSAEESSGASCDATAEVLASGAPVPELLLPAGSPVLAPLSIRASSSLSADFVPESLVLSSRQVALFGLFAQSPFA